MRRLVAGAVAVCMLMGGAFAVDVDFEKLTDAELKELIEGANAEVFERLIGKDDEVGEEMTDDGGKKVDLSWMNSVSIRNAVDEGDGNVKLRKGSFVYDRDGIRIKIVGDMHSRRSYAGDIWIDMDVIIENGTAREIFVYSGDCYMNGWEIGCSFSNSLKPGKKAKDTITFMHCDTNASVFAVDEVEEIVMGLRISYSDTYETVTERGYAVTMVP